MDTNIHEDENGQLTYTSEPRLTPQYGESILVQLPMTEAAKARFPYVLIGESCCSFSTPEPITRYFAMIDGYNHSHSQTMLSSTNVYVPQLYVDLARHVVCYAPREMQVKTCRGEARRGETWWELFRRWDFPGAKYLDTSVKHPRAQWWGCNVAKPGALPRIQRITRLLEENPFNNTN